MNIVYAIINFAILVLLIVLLGRKKIAEIFRSRKDRIDRDISFAEEAEKETLTLPEPERADPPEALAAARLADIAKENETKLAEAHSAGAEMRREMRREMISGVHREAVSAIRENVLRMLGTEPYATALRQKEPQMVQNIVGKVQLTPGDIAYLKTHDVLYVTLTSAFPLPEELVRQIEEYTDRILEAVGGKTSFWVKENPDLLGGLCLRIGDTVYDCSVTERLYQMEHRMQKDCIEGTEDAARLAAELREDLDAMGEQVFTYQLGRVLTVSDGICWMDGLADIMYGEVVEFASGNRGMVLDIQPGKIGCVIYGDYAHIESGSRVRRVGKIASVPVGEALLGRVVDALGHAIDGKGQIRTGERRPIECKAPAILERASVSEPLHTGIKAIDALVPIGKGQRELVIGDRQTGKSALAVDAIISQRGRNVMCIYVAIGQKDTTVAGLRAKLEQNGAMKYTIIVCADASESASLQYIAPFAATAMGEYFMYAGRDVLIVYDDLSKHAVAYRELSLLLHRPSGREAYPGDIFYLHSRLLERAAKLSPELGGGSMTALPLLETLAGDISSYIPTNVISITDGQIFLDTELFYAGQRPAINVGLSVSRVGSAAQTKLMKQVSASLRMRLAQYRELSGFAQFGADVDADTQKTLDAGVRMMTALRQRRFSPLEDWQEALLIFAVAEGFADSVPVPEFRVFESELYAYFETKEPQLRDVLATGAKMTDDVTARVRGALATFAGECVWQGSNN